MARLAGYRETPSTGHSARVGPVEVIHPQPAIFSFKPVSFAVYQAINGPISIRVDQIPDRMVLEIPFSPANEVPEALLHFGYSQRGSG